MRFSLEEYWDFYRRDCFFEGKDANVFAFAWFMIFPTGLWARFCARFICPRYGHKYKDIGSYANGDSAAEYLQCKRCGESWHHIYY